MFQFDFSETKKQLSSVKEFLLHGGTEEDRKKAIGTVDTLTAKLDFNQTVIWSIFAGVSISCTLVILWFIDSFNQEQEKYENVLTSYGRNRVEYQALLSEDASTTELVKDNQKDIPKDR